MKPRTAIDVLLVGTETEAARLEELAVGLRRSGHETFVALSTDEALGRPTPGALIVTEAAGHSLFGAFELPAGTPHRLFLSSTRDFDLACAATRAGANEILVTPTLDELGLAVERALPRFQRPATSSRHLARSYNTDQRHRALLDLVAFTTSLGLERSLRLRVATAISELFENAAQHAYVDRSGVILIEASLAADPLGVDRLVVEVQDLGTGAELQSSGGDEPTGLDFVRALSERLDLTSHDTGLTARVEFVLSSPHFEEDPAGLDALDYFDPLCLRELYAVLNDPAEDHGTDLFRLAPAATPTLGRVLAAGRTAEAALFAAPR